uniref:Uncharacterized protein n=1 Tax=Anguilla anguilla TaxID=7936 RepID=A0A0E9TWS5_ANGAN
MAGSMPWCLWAKRRLFYHVLCPLSQHTDLYTRLQ